MTASFGPVVASNSGSDTSEECHPCGRGRRGPARMAEQRGLKIAEAFKQVN